MIQIDLDIEDPEQLTIYLSRNGYLPPGESARLSKLEGGVSNRTVLVEFGDNSWVLKQALGQLRVAVEWFADPGRIHREALGLHWLQGLTPGGSIPTLIFEDPDQHVIAMRAVPQPHYNWKTALLSGVVDRTLIEQFGGLLGDIHHNSTRRRAEIAPIFEDRSFFEALRLEPYYSYTAQQVPGAAQFLYDLIELTRNTRLALVHGDYSPKNILVYDGRLILLDHEVIHFGDPAFDLGFSLTHFLSKAHHLPDHRAEFAQAAKHYWSVYRARLGETEWTKSMESRVVRHTLACCLARVAGRSPLEYLDRMERNRQKELVMGLMIKPPGKVPDLVDKFVGGLSR